MPELKPCPFCGSVDAPIVEKWSQFSGRCFVVSCHERKRGCSCSSGWKRTAEEATAEWNRRADQTIADEALDLLEEMFSAYEDGVDCYEEPAECEGHVGKAVKLDETTFKRIADLLEGIKPVPLQDRVKAAVLAEREACAKVLSDYAEKNRDSLCRGKQWSLTKRLSSMVRERGAETP